MEQVRAIHNQRMEHNIKAKKSKVHTKEQVDRIVDKAKLGLYEKQSRIYNYLMNGTKKDKVTDIMAVIDTLTP